MLTKQQASAQAGLHVIELEMGINAALQARLRADAAYSNFRVGAAFFAHEKAIFTGSNWETAADNGMCAEGTGLGTLRHTACPPEDIRAVFVVGAPKDSADAMECTPCGGCRDRMTEYLSPDTSVVSVGIDGRIFAVRTLRELHPTRYIDLTRDIGLQDSQSICANHINRTNQMDEDILRGYAPYHPANNVQITIHGTDMLDQNEHYEFTAASVQNASFTLATDPAGILQAHAAHEGCHQINLICYKLLTPEAVPSAASYQRLREFCRLETPLVIINSEDKIVWSGTLDQALPHSFGPNNMKVAPLAKPEEPPRPPGA